MKIYAARHGQTRWNVENIVCGRSDIPLTAEGEKQAQALADKAADCRLDVIIASPMIRAQQTARAVAERCGIEVLTDKGLSNRASVCLRALPVMMKSISSTSASIFTNTAAESL